MDDGPASFDAIVLSLPGTFQASLPIAAARAGALGLLDLCHLRAEQAGDARAELARLQNSVEQGRTGVCVFARWDELHQQIHAAARGSDTVVLVAESSDDLSTEVNRWREVAARVGLVVTNGPAARAAIAAGADFLIAKGHEAGGLVGEETTFILVQRLIGQMPANARVPVYAWGGIGLRTAAACVAAGAAGVVLDWQLGLLRESPLSDSFKRRLAQMDGSETVAITGPAGEIVRLYWQPGMTARDRLLQLSDRVQMGQEVTLAEWRQTIGELLVAEQENDRLWALGQDAALASLWARELTDVPNVARALGLLRERSVRAIEGAREARALAPDGPLAASHGTEFPVAQGPMTRVSDVPDFALKVAEGGGLPFLALALLSGEQSRDLLKATQTLLGKRPWGVGVLGFVDRELRAKQFAAIEEVCPPFAIIAGGRPDQAAGLEAKGICTYLHVPSPGMLSMFLTEGGRRFIFEGRECGGHVGPRSSFVLWESMIQVLLDAKLPDDELAKIHVLFAGGVHDALSGAMVATLAQPLVERGIKIGVLLGTAYLFTEEIVSSGAILPGFQAAALETQHTVLLETGPGHATRCADTEFYRVFLEERARLKREQVPAEQLREELESLNLGRLRIASKGVARRSTTAPGESPYVQVDADTQRREGMFMIGQVAALRERPCTVRELHDDVCRGALARLAALHDQASVSIVPVEPAPAPLDIAIVGMGCLMPGAHGLADYWNNILRKKDLVREVPADRFDWQRWYDADRNARDKVYSRWGGFLEDVPFDPLKYGIPPAALASIEPMQLLALELVDQCLRDAGYRDHNPYKERTSVILGAGGGIAELGAGYAVRASIPGLIENPDERLWSQLPEWTEDSFAGILLNVVAGRISNRFDFGGVNFTVDAACASSLSAVYLACRELADGTSDLVITGGCDTLQSPFTYLCFAKAGALSPRGKSRTFDSTSDGIAISEGLAAVCLKRRADAERDGDRIYAVIRAVSGGSDGRSKGMTAPRKEGQIRTLERAYAQARFSPATVGLFEAHGTGTAVGDQTECQSVTTVLKSREVPPQSIAVGSVKSMVGHTKCTAGVASLIKSALALHHRVLPPTLHVDTPNAKAGLVDGPLYVNSELRPWIRGEHPRRAAVSSFGFGGTNFHAVLEEYTGAALSTEKLTPHRERPAELFLLAGNSPSALAQRIKSLADPLTKALAAGKRIHLGELALAWQRRQGAAAGTSRAAVVAATPEQLLERLQALAARLAGTAAASGGVAGVYCTESPLGGTGPLAMLFPGQGSQYPNMLCPLAVEFSEVAGCFERADAELRGAYEQPLSTFVYPPPAFDDAQRQRQTEALKATDVLQPALGAADVGMARLLAACGVVPAMVAGHSYGELVALHVAGAIDEAALYRLSLARGRAIVEMSAGHERDLGRMLAVRAPEHEVRAALAGSPEVWLANMNSPRQTIISGTQAGLAHATQQLEAARLASTPIAVSCGFHSPLMEPARARFAEALAQVDLRPAQIDVFSNTTAEPYPTEPAAMRQRLAEHLVRQVHFAAEIEAMYAAGARVFVEAGPGRVLTKLTSEILGNRPHVVVATQITAQNGYPEFLATLGELYAHGVSIDVERLYQGRELKTLDLAELAAPSKPLPKHFVLINGSYLRPAGTPPRQLASRVSLLGDQPTAPQPAAAAPSAAPKVGATPSLAVKPPVSAPIAATAGSHAAPAAAAGPIAAPPVPVAPAASPAPLAVQPPAPEMGDVAMREFQHTMRAFLDAQEKVLTAYLTGSPAMAASPPAPPITVEALPLAASGPVVAMPTVEASTPLAPTVAASASAAPPLAAPVPPPAPRTIAAATYIGAAGPIISPAPAPREQQPTKAAESTPVTSTPLDEFLVEIVSDRTGYPGDMLSMQANLEADLGIDSIKRVEIIGAFRRAALPSIDEPPGWFMEKMTGASTLQQILDGVHELVGEQAPQAASRTDGAKAPAAPATVSEAAAVDPAQLEQMLVEVVSDRTGYPGDMLALDANLEADLGIDSIKRVEIIGAFRRAALPSIDEPPGWFMERMTGASTLRQILAGVADLAGTAAAPEAQAAAAPAHTAPHAAAPAEAAALDQDQLTDMLLGVVSDRTGYPKEMLGLTANLEADLGIDSIKKVEIVGAFRRAALPSVDEPPAWFMERLSGAGTLAQILDGVTALHAQITPAAAHPETSAVSAASTEVAGTPSVAPEQLQQLLVDVVSERTGYPADMLALDANLEADLGIDSIKRVEIIGAFRRAVFPHIDEPPAWFMEEMTSAANLRAILNGVERLSVAAHGNAPSNGTSHGPSNGYSRAEGNGAKANGALPASAPAAETTESTPRCVPAILEAPLAKETRMPQIAGAVVLTDDGRGVTAALQRELQAQGLPAEIIPAEVLASRDATTATLSLVRQRYGAIGALVHLVPLTQTPEFPGIDPGTWRSRVEAELKGLLHLLQGAAPDLGGAYDGNLIVLAATLGGGDFGGDAAQEASRPWRGGIAGMLKTAAKEWIGARFRAIDFDAVPEIELLLAELQSTGPVEVGYRHARRLTVAPMRQEFATSAAGERAQLPGLRRESVVLVTGGARGITAHVARALAARSQATMVLLGRSPLPVEAPHPWAESLADPGQVRKELINRLRAAGTSPSPREVERELVRILADREIRENLQAIAQAGSRVEYHACDVRDEQALAAVINDVQSRLGPIDALIHGAGVIEDRYIVDKSDDSFDRVVGTKLDGAFAFTRLLDPRQLRYCLLFSSVSGFFGNPGQVDYAAANEVLNRMAARLARVWSQTKVAALNWGPWSGAGMVTAEVARQFAERGVGMVTLPGGCQAVVNEFEFADGTTNVLYGPGPWLADAERLAAQCAAVSVATALLAGQVVHRLSNGTIEAYVTLDAAQHGFLRDHMIDQKPVFPAAFALELMAETALAAAPPGWHVTHVENLRAFAGIVLDEPTRTILVRAEAIDWQESGGVWRVRIVDPQKPGRPMYESLVRVSAFEPEVPEAPNLPRIESAFPLPVPEAYERWLFHGPILQAIIELRGLDPSGVDAVFAPGNVEHCLGGARPAGWLIDPVILDAAPQLGMLWSRAVHDTSPLPNRVAVYHRFGPLGSEPVEALFRLDPSSNENWYKADVWLLRGNRVVGLMEGLEGAGSAALNRIARSASR
ncbi:MAG: SDR family NAD(P)-dependent oxidoreductase [Pirellulales bacterium]|nr:SDR family NAD(P)-dependent oxidoreductase [Pirellulales bacterium]